MSKSSKWASLRKGLALLSAAALVSAMIVPAALAVEYDYDYTDEVVAGVDANSAKSTKTADSENKATINDLKTDVMLRVLDTNSKTISVTAPVAVYLAAKYDSSKDDYTTDFLTPSAEAFYIQNNSVGSSVKVTKWDTTTASEAVKGLAKVKGEDSGSKGYYSNEEGTLKETEDAKHANTFWLQVTANNNGKADTQELALSAANLTGDNANAWKMLPNPTGANQAAYTYIPLTLAGQIFAPDSAATAYGNENGKMLASVAWTFELATTE